MKKELLELLEKDPTIQTTVKRSNSKVTPEGVLISVFNKPDAPIFDPNTDGFTQQGEWLMGNLAYTFDKFSEHEFEIQGHTNVRLDANGKPIDSWKLSVDRAAKTRKFLHRSKCSARTNHSSQWLWRYPNARKPISAKPTEQSGRYPDSESNLKAFYLIMTALTEAFVPLTSLMDTMRNESFETLDTQTATLSEPAIDSAVKPSIQTHEEAAEVSDEKQAIEEASTMPATNPRCSLIGMEIVSPISGSFAAAGEALWLIANTLIKPRRLPLNKPFHLRPLLDA